LNKKKEILRGVFFAIISSFSGLILATLFLSENDSIIDSLKNSYYENFLGKLISLGAILNVLVFFVFIRRIKIKEQKAFYFLQFF